MHNNVTIATVEVCGKVRGSGCTADEFTLEVAHELILGTGAGPRFRKLMLQV